MSHDIEDIIAVLDGRSEIIDEVKQTEPHLVSELSTRFEKLLNTQSFVEAVSGHMPTDETSLARAKMIMKTIKAIAGIK